MITFYNSTIENMGQKVVLSSLIFTITFVSDGQVCSGKPHIS